MTDDRTGFICWFLKQGRSWAAIWPEIRLRQDMNLHGQSDLRELQAETRVFGQCGIRLLRTVPGFRLFYQSEKLFRRYDVVKGY